MIKVEQHVVLVDRFDNASIASAIRRRQFNEIARLVLRACRDVRIERRAREPLHQLWIAGSEGFALGKSEAALVTICEPDQTSLEWFSQLADSELERSRFAAESADDIGISAREAQAIVKRQMRTGPRPRLGPVRGCAGRFRAAARFRGYGIRQCHFSSLKEASMVRLAMIPLSHRPGARRVSSGRPRTESAAPPTRARLGGLAQRLLADGPQALSDAEVLSLLFRPGARDALPVARALRMLRNESGSLLDLSAPPWPASSGRGIAPQTLRDRLVLQAALEFARRCLAQTLTEQPVIDSPATLRHFLSLWLGPRERECFVVLFLNTQHRLIRAEEMFQGSLAQTVVYPREIAKKSLQWSANSIIIAHNHPSGAAGPSSADRHLTQAIANALRLLDVAVLDHIIIAGTRSYSFAEHGML